MKKVIVVATGANRGIGFEDRLPWFGRQRADMRRFRELTMGFPVIMGRKTYESIPKRPLPGRRNIVLTRQPVYGVVGVRSFVEAFEVAGWDEKKKSFIIGGAEIYEQALEFADEIELTLIHHVFETDRKFSELNPVIWEKVRTESHPMDAENAFPYSFLTYRRKS